MQKLIKGLAPRVSLLTYLIGSALVSLGATLVYLPAGVIAVGVLLIALVVDGKS